MRMKLSECDFLFLEFPKMKNSEITTTLWKRPSDGDGGKPNKTMDGSNITVIVGMSGILLPLFDDRLTLMNKCIVLRAFVIISYIDTFIILNISYRDRLKSFSYVA